MFNPLHKPHQIAFPARTAGRILREIERSAPTWLYPDRASEELAQAYLDAGVGGDSNLVGYGVRNHFHSRNQ